MTPHLVFDGALKKAKRVQVLDLAAGSELVAAGWTHGNVGIAAEGSFLHVAVADLDPTHQRVERLGVRHRLLSATHVGLRYDFQQWGAGPVEVDATQVVELLMQQLAGVLFQVGAGEADDLLDFAHRYRDPAALHDRQLVLTDLVAFGEIRIEIVLARNNRTTIDGSTNRESKTDRPLDCPFVCYRQHTRERDIHRAGLRVGCGAERRRSTREHLGCRRQLSVRLQADHDFPLHDGTYAPKDRIPGYFLRFHAHPAGVRRCQSVVR